MQIVGAEATSLHRALSSDADSASLIVASYPVGHDVLKLLKGSKVPTIMLLNCIDRDMVHVLVESRNICCMVKPLDYRKFRLVVQDALAGSFRERGEVLVD
ncbi:MAG TPA: hypothetical protein VK445_07035 [Dissulfurispiraceae bacterium]|nr:hypothetical protein [Dissulfurispiraceae bacterium]